MRVLVTGAAGFLGQAVCRALDTSHEITGVDTASIPFGGLAIKPLYSDITTPLSLGFCAPDGLDAVVHMAAIAAPRTCDADPTLAYDVNVNGTHQVLKLAVEAGAKKFVFLSSAHVYGISPRYMPTDEAHPLHPQETYTTTKILGERLCELYHENYGLSYTTLRLFNAYGPGQLPGYFIPDMIVKARSGGITLNGGGTTKDFVYVDDVARAVLSAIETDYVGAINIGTGSETSLSEVARIISEIKRVDSNIIDGDGGTRMQADWSRAKQVLDWEPKVDIVEGLRATIKAS